MIRSSKHILKYQTNIKNHLLDELFDIYKAELSIYIEAMYLNELSIRQNLSSKLIPGHNIKGGQWKQLIYKHASQILRSYGINREPMPKVTNLTITLDHRFYNIKHLSSNFNGFIEIMLPFLDPEFKNNRRIAIRLPFKEHKHSLKYNSWIRKDTIRLLKVKNNYYIEFLYEKEEPKKREVGDSIGFDSGYKHFLVNSNGEFYGEELNRIYNKLAKQRRGSKNYNQTLFERDKLINQVINRIPTNGVKEIITENLKNVKYKTKFSRKFNNKLQYWSYRKGLDKLSRICEENGIQFIQVNPAYTSQHCPKCGFTTKENRYGDQFHCCKCEYTNHADIVGAINILNRGEYNPSIIKNTS